MKISKIVNDLWCVQEFLEKSLKGHYLEAKKERTTIFVCNTSPLPNTHSYKIAGIYHEQ